MRKVTWLLVVAAVLIGGCTAGNPDQAVNRDAKTTFLTATDMTTMTDQMAAAIVADPYIQAEWKKGPMRVVIKPVINETNEIIRDNRKELFVARLQGLLATRPQLRDKFVWVINREDYEKLRAEEVDVTGPSEDRVQPEYALYAHFLADTHAAAKTRGDVYLCQYNLLRLQGAETGAQLWTGQYETSKHIKKGLLD
jgi:hypothetical protein